MHTTKKMLVAALLVSTAAVLVFAQRSMTSYSTAPGIASNLDEEEGLFTTDVDDFMNVNEWHNVMPEKAFAYLGYGRDGKGTNGVDFGFAKQLKAVYLGAWFNGKFANWTSTTDTPDTKKGKKDLTNVTTGGDKTQFAVLAGFGNMGVRADFSFKPTATNNKYEKHETIKTEKTHNKFEMTTGVKFGMNVNGPKDMLLKTNAEVSLESHLNKETDIINDKTDITDSSTFDLNVNGGASFDFMQKDALTQSAGLALETKWKIYPAEDQNKQTTKTVVKTVGRLDDTITLTPEWMLSYEPEGKFAFRAGAKLPVKVHFDNQADYTDTTTNGTSVKAYGDRIHKVTTTLTPALSGAMTWQPIPKLRFNFGMGFKVPSGKWESQKTERRASNSATVTKTEENLKWTFTGNDGKFGVSSGLTWFVTDKVTVDGNWDLVKRLLGNNPDFETDIDGASGSILDTANKLLVHKIRFLVTVKL